MTGWAAGRLVLLRHGESTGNEDGIFTGILDLPLTVRGRREAEHARALLLEAGLAPDAVVTSTMRRALETVELLTDRATPAIAPQVPLIADPRLNERNYGALTGRTKAEVRTESGERQYLDWRRSLTARPPEMDTAMQARLLQQAAPGSERLGRTESLADVVIRVQACFDEAIRPRVGAGRTVLVVAHGNSLRALCTVLDRLTPSAVAALNLPTGHPLLYRFDRGGRPAPAGGTYLDPEPALHAAELIARQGGT